MQEFIALARSDGLVLEFGVAAGSSITYIANAVQPRTVYGFDSFEGLPEDWADEAGEMHNLKGTFACEVPTGLPSNVQLMVGLFQDTLPDFLAGHPDSIAFVHVDSDLYSSAMFIMRTLGTRLDGVVMAFDEFCGCPAYDYHEGRAVEDFVLESGFRFERLDNNDAVRGVFRVTC